MIPQRRRLIYSKYSSQQLGNIASRLETRRDPLNFTTNCLVLYTLLLGSRERCSMEGMVIEGLGNPLNSFTEDIVITPPVDNEKMVVIKPNRSIPKSTLAIGLS